MCYCLDFPELPLKGNYDNNKFKLYFADSGLLVAMLDEPTSNLDSLNEAVILKVLRDEGAGRTVAVVWVCHVVYFVFGVKTIREEE